MDLTVGSACECVSARSLADRGYGAWLSVFRDLTTGDKIKLVSEDDPKLVVGKRYRLEVTAVLLD